MSPGITLCALVEQGLGVGIVDSESARVRDNAGLVFRPLLPRIMVPIYMFRQRNRRPGTVAEAFSASLQPPPSFPTGA